MVGGNSKTIYLLKLNKRGGQPLRDHVTTPVIFFQDRLPNKSFRFCTRSFRFGYMIMYPNLNYQFGTRSCTNIYLNYLYIYIFLFQRFLFKIVYQYLLYLVHDLEQKINNTRFMID